MPSNVTYSDIDHFVLNAPHASGDAFTLSFDVRLSEQSYLYAYLYNPDGNTDKRVYVDGTYVKDSIDGSVPYNAGPEWRHVAITWEYKTAPVQPVDYIIPARMFGGIVAVGTTLEVRNLMLVEGATPAAWAPADGETLSGGGAQMGANLWSDSTASMQIRADGTYLAGKASGALSSAVTGLSSLTENQTVHIGASLKNAGAGVLKPFVEYKDAAGNLNWVGFPSWQPTASWQRFEGSAVVPSGMTVTKVGFNNFYATGDIEVSNPVFCYGSTGIVMAAGSVTVASITDVASTTRWYMLQSSTLTAPTAPTASPPGGSWQTTEPTYTEGSTNSLYFVDETIFSDGTWAYSSVSLSSSYEAAKAAYNKAAAAYAAAATTDQHFWADTDGAHISSTGDHDTSGFHQLMTSVKNAFMHGTTELMTISASLIELGKNSASSIIRMCGGKVAVSAVPDGKDRYTGILSGDYGAKIRSANGITSVGVDGFQNLISMVSGYLLVDDETDAPTQVSMKRFLTAIQPVVLYNGGAALTYDTAPGTGTTGTVTLSETAANFKEILLYLTDNNGKTAGVFTVAALPGATTVANGQTADCFGFEASNGATTWTYIRRTRYTVTGGTTLVPSNGGYVSFQSGVGVGYSNDSVNYLKVYRVEGRR